MQTLDKREYSPTERFFQQADSMVQRGKQFGLGETPTEVLLQNAYNKQYDFDRLTSLIIESMLVDKFVPMTLASSAGTFGSLVEDDFYQSSDPNNFSSVVYTNFTQRNKFGLKYMLEMGLLNIGGKIVEWHQNKDQRQALVQTCNNIRALYAFYTEQINFRHVDLIPLASFIQTSQPFFINSGAPVATRIVTALANIIKSSPETSGFSPEQMRNSTAASVANSSSLGYMLMRGGGGVLALNNAEKDLAAGRPIAEVRVQDTSALVVPTQEAKERIRQDRAAVQAKVQQVSQDLEIESVIEMGVCPFGLKYPHGGQVVDELIPKALQQVLDEAWLSDSSFE